METRITRQLLNGKDPQKLTPVEWSDLLDEIEDTHEKLSFLKTGLESTLKNTMKIQRDIKRSGQHALALELHTEMLFIGRLIATLDILLLRENVIAPLDELFETVET